MKWKLLGMLIFMTRFYNGAGRVVEAAPVDKSSVHADIAGWQAHRPGTAGFVACHRPSIEPQPEPGVKWHRLARLQPWSQRRKGFLAD
jgi:hypothetical protein